MRALLTRLRSIHPRVYDAALAVVFVAISVVTLALADPDPPQRSATPVAYVLAVIGVGAIAWRSRYPVGVLLVSTSCIVAMTIAGFVEAGAPFAVMIAFYSVASAPQPRSRLIGAGVLLVAFGLLYAFNDNSDFGTGELATNTIFFGAVWVVGERVRARRERMAMLEERAAQVVREQEERERRAIADERLRIAQELHDVVAHAMSVITVQAGVGAHVIDEQPEQAKKALAAIEATGRSALQELRLMVGVLRQDGDQRGARQPSPSRASVEELVESVRATGLPVDLRWEGDPDRNIPPGLFATAYRIVQEALTNVLKHAGTASAVVTIRVDPRTLTIEVVDDGRGAASNAGGHDVGFGLVGMHERAHVLGGTLEAGPRPGGGFAVRAELPCSPATIGAESIG